MRWPCGRIYHSDICLLSLADGHSITKPGLRFKSQSLIHASGDHIFYITYNSDKGKNSLYCYSINSKKNKLIFSGIPLTYSNTPMIETQNYLYITIADKTYRIDSDSLEYEVISDISFDSGCRDENDNIIFKYNNGIYSYDPKTGKSFLVVNVSELYEVLYAENNLIFYSTGSCLWLYDRSTNSKNIILDPTKYISTELAYYTSFILTGNQGNYLFFTISSPGENLKALFTYVFCISKSGDEIIQIN